MNHRPSKGLLYFVYQDTLLSPGIAFTIPTCSIQSFMRLGTHFIPQHIIIYTYTHLYIYPFSTIEILSDEASSSIVKAPAASSDLTGVSSMAASLDFFPLSPLPSDVFFISHSSYCFSGGTQPDQPQF